MSEFTESFNFQPFTNPFSSLFQPFTNLGGSANNAKTFSAESFASQVGEQNNLSSPEFKRNERERGLGQPIYVMGDSKDSGPNINQNVSANIGQGANKIAVSLIVFFLALIAFKLYQSKA